jgi:hypothetical protein
MLGRSEADDVEALTDALALLLREWWERRQTAATSSPEPSRPTDLTA